MKGQTTIAASLAALTLILLCIPGSADARARRYWRHHGDYALYYDYSHSSWLSPLGYVYPAANWGPFFHRVRHYGPVLPYDESLPVRRMIY